MDGTTVKELAARFREPRNLDGFILRPADWVAEDPAALMKAAPAAVALQVSTLGAVRDYVTANRDALELGTLIAFIHSPGQVWLGGPLRERSHDREWYVTAKALDLTDGFLGVFHAAETFIVGLQTRFAEQ